MPNLALGKHECLNCSNLFIASQSDADDIFKKQYCSKSCQEEDITTMESTKIPTIEPAPLPNVQTIAGGFKIHSKL